MARYALALASLLALSGCSESTSGVTAPSGAAHLTAAVTPSPLTAPTEAGTDMFWNLELRAGSSNVTVIEADVQLLDASGLIVGHTKELWSQSAGCSVCSGEWTISARSAPTFTGRRVRYVGGGRPAKFVYRLSFFAEGSGPGTTMVEVPVR
jgi:hypothetical protein